MMIEGAQAPFVVVIGNLQPVAQLQSVLFWHQKTLENSRAALLYLGKDCWRSKKGLYENQSRVMIRLPP